jgi:MFS family permease
VVTNNRYRFVIQASVILVRICVGLIWASAGPLLPFIMQEYGFGRGTAGWFASAAPIAVAIIALPLGIIGARFSLKKVFAVGALLQAAGILAPFCGSYLPLVMTRVFFAIGTAITVPLATAIAAEWFSSRELPLVNGITIGFVSLGNTFTYMATVPIATVLAWKAPITIYGAFALTCATLWIIFGKDRKKVETAGQATSFPQPKGDRVLGIKQALTQRSTIVLTLAVMGAWTLSNAMGSWLPTYYHEVFGMSLQKASSITAIITVMGVIASISGGFLPMRIGRRKPFLIIPGIFMGVTALCSILFNNTAVIFLCVALFGLSGNLQNAVIYTLPLELPNMSHRTGSVVFSLMLAGGNFGNFMGPLIVGYMADATGSYIPGFIACAVMSLSLLAAGIILPETGPAARYPNTFKLTGQYKKH